MFDILGRRVSTLVDEEYMPGSYEIGFDGSGFASGVYFVRVRYNPVDGSGDVKTVVKKVLLVK